MTMANWIFLSFIILTTFIRSESRDLAFDLAPISDDPWDVDGPCQGYVEKFARVQADMVMCATNWSIPPKVCTNCFDQYIAFKQMEYETKHLDNTYSRDNHTCTQVIYDNYLISYGHEISDALSNRIWDQSRCEFCLDIYWNFTGNSSYVDFNNITQNFEEKLYFWRDCVVNYTETDDGNTSSICTACKKPFDHLFKYYWDIYVHPDVQFCVDVETTMNDTLHIWNDVWECDERKDRRKETALVMYTSLVLAVLIGLFYASSYIQGGGEKRAYVRYSRRAPPPNDRVRLMSSSSSDHNLARYQIATSSHLPPAVPHVSHVS